MDVALAARRVRDHLKSAPPVYWPLRWARMTIGGLVPPRQLAGVPGRIHANDSMIPKRVAEHVPGYAGSGKQIAGLIGGHLGADASPARSLVGLDLGCGYGRVLRHLVTDLPFIRWTAADVDRRAVRFCAKEFGVTGTVSSRRMKDLRFADAPFDVIWMGSLLTHLSPRASEDLWAMLRSNLRPGGILALSTHGPEILGRLDEWVPHGATQHDRLSRDLNATGIAYLQYPHYRRVGYGVTFHTSEALRTKVDDVFGGGSQRLSFRPKGWLETQDLYVFRIPGAASHPGRRGGTPPPW